VKSLHDKFAEKAYKAARRATDELGLPKPERDGPREFVCPYPLNGEWVPVVRVRIEDRGVRVNDTLYPWEDPQTGDDQAWYEFIKEHLEKVHEYLDRIG
jgi:hypothetical protein